MTDTPAPSIWPGVAPVEAEAPAPETKATAKPAKAKKAATTAMPSSRTAARKTAPTDIEGLTLDTLDKNDPMMKLVPISLNDTAEIPPGGQFVGVNGKQFWLLPGVVYNVPRYVLEVLRNAVKGEPTLNEHMQVEGYRNVPRIPYTVRDDMMDL